MKKFILSLACIGAVFTFQSCHNDDGGNMNNSTPEQEVMNNYADIVYASYEDSYALAKVLEEKINVFLANPTEANFEAAKQAWYDSREPYGQTEAYRFGGGPIDFGDDQVEGMVNAWPLDESYIDYVAHSEESNTNIINNVEDYPIIDKALLRKLNEGLSERSISLGYHAIEFLLWGQDTQIPVAGAEHTTGGKRPYTDFVDGGTATHQDRRRQFLKVTTEVLLEDLKYLVDSWDKNGNNYRSEFLAMQPKEAMGRVLAGIGVLAGSELSEERILVAISGPSQEDEHSCFSDNTHRDIIVNFQGIKNVFLGEYTRLDGSKIKGVSLYDLLKEKDAETANKIVGEFKEVDDAIAQTIIPFDYAITQADEVERLNIVVNKLRDLGSAFGKTGSVLGATNYTAPE